MKFSTAFAALSLALHTEVVLGITPITVKGNAFFLGDKRFYMRGVDYQPGGSSANKDPIADSASCKRDIVEFKKLGINTIRVYAVDNSVNHDECMKALADANIYLAVDVNTPLYSLNRDKNWTIGPSYNEIYLQSVFATIDAFAKYDNTMLFFSGNEVISETETYAAPYIKAVGRDMKSYIKARSYRAIPVGYSATDVKSNRYLVANYLNCGSDDIRSDFLAFNDYSFCGEGSFKGSQWADKVGNLSSYNIPLFMSEYGCKEVIPRRFSEVPVLYSSDMTPVYSGGLIYEYSMEESKFGLVQITGDTVTELPDFSTLKGKFDNAPLPTNDGGYKSSGQASACPPSTATWKINGSLPIIPSGAAAFFKNGAGAGFGSHDPKWVNGSQWAGNLSPSTASTGWTDADKSGSGTSGSSPSGSPKPKSGAMSNAAPVMSMALVFAAVALFGL